MTFQETLYLLLHNNILKNYLENLSVQKVNKYFFKILHLNNKYIFWFIFKISLSLVSKFINWIYWFIIYRTHALMRESVHNLT